MGADEYWVFTSSVACYIAQGKPSLVFTAEADDDTATAAAHGMDAVEGPYTATAGTALPTGLTADTEYWVFTTGVNTFQFAASLADATAGVAIELDSDGTGTLTLVRNMAPAAADRSTYVSAGESVLIAGLVGPKLSVVRESSDGVATLTRVHFVK